MDISNIDTKNMSHVSIWFILFMADAGFAYNMVTVPNGLKGEFFRLGCDAEIKTPAVKRGEVINEKFNVAGQLQTKFSVIARYYTTVSVNNSVHVLFKNSQNLLLILRALH
jgi:hypothetical protein